MRADPSFPSLKGLLVNKGTRLLGVGPAILMFRLFTCRIRTGLSRLSFTESDTTRSMQLKECVVQVLVLLDIASSIAKRPSQHSESVP